MMILPSGFITSTKALIGEEFVQLETALTAESPVSIRLNQAKGLSERNEEPVAWCKTGYYLPERLSFTFDPLFHAGAYYVQEASSMFLEQAIVNLINGPVKCLDLCAAPGGKSTHLAGILPEGSLLVSNEVIRSRSHILAENITKWGNPYTIVTNNDPEEIGRLTHMFDVIVADVPCSGEGMFRKDPESFTEWSETNVDMCASRQRRIIHDAWNALKPGGILIYSTCTYNTKENEDNIHHFITDLDADPVPIPIQKEWNITGALKYNHPVYRFFPHKTKGEGFFLAAIRKKEDTIKEIRLKPKKEKKAAGSTLPTHVADWLTIPDLFSIEVKGEIIKAYPALYTGHYRYISEYLRVVSAGISIGEIKGKDIIPSHSLALSNFFNRDSFQILELSWEESISFLRKEALPPAVDKEKGCLLVTYKNFPLGFVKNLGNRMNNLYPQEWRIRSGFIPEEIKMLAL